MAASGSATNQRVAISAIPGTPDGLRVAENGNLYVACKGIDIYTPAGNLLQMVDLPETPTNCTFGGPDFANVVRDRFDLDLPRLYSGSGRFVVLNGF